jgi:2-dehydropantoate 2-reductase
MSQESTIEKICVYGIGGVGGYFGSKIACAITEGAENKYKSYFIARGAHLEAIKRDGIKLVSPEQNIVGKPNMATDDINQIPDPDLFLVCVKSYDLDDVVKSIKPKVKEKTVIIPLLNGADIYDRIRANLSTGIVLPACVFVGTHIEKPGVILQSGGDGRILFGKDPEHKTFDPGAVVSAFKDLGISCQWNENPFPAIWSKYIFIASFGLVTVYTGKCLGEIMEDSAAKKCVLEIMQEIFKIAHAKGIELPSDIIEKSITKAKDFPYDTKTSYQRDVELKGKINEGDLYGGTIIKEGKSSGIPTPVTSSIYSEIQNRCIG